MSVTTGSNTTIATVQKLLEGWDPDTPAVAAADGTLTYGQLQVAADALAARLWDSGVRSGSLVGVCLPRSAALVVAYLAVLRSGAVYVALDPDQPAPRLAGLIDDSAVRVVIGAPAVVGTLAGCTVAEAVDGVGVIATRETAAEETMATVELTGLAYVMFTSGSTGRPKGVMVGHEGVVNLARWHGSAFGVRPGQRCSQIGAPGFDAAAWEIWGTLGNGGTLVVAPQELKTDPLGLRDWLVEQRIAVSFVPTPVAEALLVLDWPADAALRVLLTGGDRLHRPARAGLPFTVVNNYGVTEASVVSTSGVVADGDGAPSIGAAIDGVQLRVVAPDMTEVAPGTAGELVVGGVSVAHGYLFDPWTTAEVFVTAPDGTGPWYRTRDVVTQRPDGAFDYAGRLDEQVQIRGNRVEPAEIAAVLDQHPEIASSVVLGVQDADAQARLAAFWVQSDASAVPLSADDVRAHVAQRLPAHMVPSVVERVERMPLTTNGKVDREALLKLVATAGVDTVPDAEADLDASVARIVAQVLKVPAIGPDENFLLKGGHSLLAAQVVARLAERFEVEISLRSLFDNPTPRGMAALVEDELVAQVLALGDDAPDDDA